MHCDRQSVAIIDLLDIPVLYLFQNILGVYQWNTMRYNWLQFEILFFHVNLWKIFAARKYAAFYLKATLNGDQHANIITINPIIVNIPNLNNHIQFGLLETFQVSNTFSSDNKHGDDWAFCGIFSAENLAGICRSIKRDTTDFWEILVQRTPEPVCVTRNYYCLFYVSIVT